MSKQSEAKTKQGYQPSPKPRVCSTCTHYRSDLIKRQGLGDTWIDEKNKRCGIGGFAVKKMGTCNEWKES